jgi:CRISPR-associated protein Csx17
MPAEQLFLKACKAEPLMAYLKSLGVLRLLGEQKDAALSGSFEGGCFKLTGPIDQDALCHFFVRDYCPTPVITPWNSASGFYSGKPVVMIEGIAKSVNPRLAMYRQAIFEARAILAGNGFDRKPGTMEKQLIIGTIRSRLPEQVVEWIDTLGVLTDEKMSYAPLLGTGGNDGRLEFAVNFMQHLLRVIPLKPDEDPGNIYEQSGAWLKAALFDDKPPELVEASTGQFNPGGIGGPNATSGFIGEPMVNPWDYILMIEGTLFLAGSVACRSGLSSRQKAAFPFTVRPSPAGWQTIAEADVKDARYEIWMPLWSRPAGFREVAHLLREGRAQVGKRQAATGSDFARAASALGVDRGLAGFARYGFYKRSGKAYLASPLGQIPVRYRTNIDLIEEADTWLQRVRRLAQGERAPESLRRAYREAESAIFSFCLRGRPAEIQGILTALLGIEKVLARSKTLQKSIDPLQGLSMRWLKASDDGSPEYRLARAAASIGSAGSGDTVLPPIRVFVEPVARERSGRYAWDPDSTACVWAGEDLTRNLHGILSRRCLDAARLGQKELAPLAGHYTAALSDIALFMVDLTDDGRLSGLFRIFAMLRWPQDLNLKGKKTESYTEAVPCEISRLYAFCKPFYHHHDMTQRTEKDERVNVVRPYQQLLTHLKHGRGERVAQFAAGKYKAAGYMPLGSSGGRGPRTPAISAANISGARIAAALLFPISSLKPLLDLVLRKKQADKPASTSKEE